MKFEEELNITRHVIDEFIIQANELKFSSENFFVITNILEQVSREINGLIKEKNNLFLVSLHVRNIFELLLILKHVDSSHENLKNWIGQMHKDLKDMIDGFNDLCESRNIHIEEFREIRTTINQSLLEHDFESKHNFNIKNLAEKYGYKNDYEAIFKLCSKFLHPSSLKINGYSVFIEENAFLDILKVAVLFYCKEIKSIISV